jgi:hypothetical protein
MWAVGGALELANATVRLWIWIRGQPERCTFRAGSDPGHEGSIQAFIESVEAPLYRRITDLEQRQQTLVASCVFAPTLTCKAFVAEQRG